MDLVLSIHDKLKILFIVVSVGTLTFYLSITHGICLQYKSGRAYLLLITPNKDVIATRNVFGGSIEIKLRRRLWGF